MNTIVKQVAERGGEYTAELQLYSENQLIANVHLDLPGDEKAFYVSDDDIKTNNSLKYFLRGNLLIDDDGFIRISEDGSYKYAYVFGTSMMFLKQHDYDVYKSNQVIFREARDGDTLSRAIFTAKLSLKVLKADLENHLLMLSAILIAMALTYLIAPKIAIAEMLLIVAYELISNFKIATGMIKNV